MLAEKDGSRFGSRDTLGTSEPMYYETLLKEIAQRMGWVSRFQPWYLYTLFKPGPSPTIPGRCYWYVDTKSKGKD